MFMKNMAENEFICGLVENLCQDMACTIEKIREYFSEFIIMIFIMKRTKNGEFDYLLYFLTIGIPDK